MMSFEEYMARRQGGDPLGTPAEMLARAGIDPGGPNEVEVKRTVKREKKRDLLAKVPGAVARS